MKTALRSCKNWMDVGNTSPGTISGGQDKNSP